jgi:Ca2+-binding RTX toxin-like protein
MATSSGSDYTDVYSGTSDEFSGDDDIFVIAGEYADGGAGFDTLYLDLANWGKGLKVNLSAALSGGTSVVAGATIQDFEAYGGITGTAFADTIILGDVYYGRGFHSTYWGIDAGDGDDIVWAGIGQDHIAGADGNDELYGRAGNDNIHGGNGDDLLEGGSDSDWLFGDFGNDTLLGGEGSDLLMAGYGSDKLYGEDGNDSLRAGSADSLLEGGADNDSLNGGFANDTLRGGTGVDSIYAGYGADLIDGGSGDDFMVGGYSYREANDGAADELIAGEGDDHVMAGLGDTASGGDGNDLISLDFLWEAEGVVVDLRAAMTGGISNLDGGEIEGFEGYEVIWGSAYDDTIDVSTRSYSRPTISSYVGIYAGSGNDRVFGGLTGDLIRGDAGADLLEGGAGDDVLIGGHDASWSADSEDELVGGKGDDHVIAGLGDKASGGDGNDLISLNLSGAAAGLVLDLRAALSGGVSTIAGAQIAGFENYHTIRGSAHADTIDGRATEADARQATGTDVGIHAGDGNDTVLGGLSGDRLFGGLGADLLEGGGGDDFLAGEGDPRWSETGVDELVGGDGDDRVAVGVGDKASGGDGNDLMTLDLRTAETGLVADLRGALSNAVSTVGDARIEDFEGYDTIWGSAHDDTINVSNNAAEPRVPVGTSIAINAGYGNDTVLGGRPGEILWGYAGDDELSGGAGDDTLRGDYGADVLDGGADDDTLFGGYEADVLRGGIGSDILIGGDHYVGSDQSSDELAAGAGDDTVIAGLDDTAFGGDGNDLIGLDLFRAKAGVVVDLRAVLKGGAATVAGTRIEGFEGYAEIQGSLFDDTIDVSTSAADARRSTVRGGGIEAWNGNDTVLGGLSGDIISGNLGADVLHGGGGDDVLFATARFDDDYEVDELIGGEGDDDLVAGIGNMASGGEGSDRLSLDLRNSRASVVVDLRAAVTGGVSTVAGAQIEGFEGYESVFGSVYDDIIDVSTSPAQARPSTALYAGLRGDFGNDIVSGGLAGDIIWGEHGDDRLSGNAGNDKLLGHFGHDVLEGGAQNDILDGSFGTDRTPMARPLPG